jgi:hypothetical protein
MYEVLNSSSIVMMVSQRDKGKARMNSGIKNESQSQVNCDGSLLED